MRRDRFIAQIEQYVPYLRRIAMKFNLDYDESSEVVGKCIEELLTMKKYTIIEPDKLKAFLDARIRFTARHHKRDIANRALDVVRLPDLEDSPLSDGKIDVPVVSAPTVYQDCPFCFRATLNKNGACLMCHTIVPSYARTDRGSIVMTKESLAVTFDFNTKVDIQNAITRLSPFEQRVVQAIGLGNESLESFAEDNAVTLSSIFRVWVTAKAKLQNYLSEYATDRVAKRSMKAFQQAIKSVHFDLK